jgi:L-ascorbate metabolism protein UlaG (beta-lactamase superfamily)
MAEIRWFGHACFRIRAREATILTDPVPRSFGYKVEKQRADIVTVSHAHPGHVAFDMLNGEYKLVDRPGEFEMHDVFITGVQTYHDDQLGAERGKNTVFLIEVESLMICHLGDLGHELTEAQAEAMNSVDVLFVPVGGNDVLDGGQASAVVAQIEPRIVIPMQYRTEFGDAQREGVERFLKEMAVGDIAPIERLTIRKSDLAEGSYATSVVVLECGATR